jgi:hypothetical protein
LSPSLLRSPGGMPAIIVVPADFEDVKTERFDLGQNAV